MAGSAGILDLFESGGCPGLIVLLRKVCRRYHSLFQTYREPNKFFQLLHILVRPGLLKIRNSRQNFIGLNLGYRGITFFNCCLQFRYCDGKHRHHSVQLLHSGISCC